MPSVPFDGNQFTPAGEADKNTGTAVNTPADKDESPLPEMQMTPITPSIAYDICQEIVREIVIDA